MDLMTLALAIFLAGWLIMRKENVGRYVAIVGAILWLVVWFARYLGFGV